MAREIINIGAVPNNGEGDPLRTAFQKLNNMTAELYADDAGDVDSVNGQTGVVVLDSDDIAEGSTNEYYTEAKVSANTSVVANTAKVGITSAQASEISANTAKTGITSSQANAITANTAKTGITAQQAADIVTNNAKNTDQTVTLTEGQNVTITGTYPNFTIASEDVVGAVNSVNGEAGTVVLDTGDISENGNLYFTDARVAANSAVTANTAKLTANTTNVTAAGALMDSEITNLSQVKAFDSSDYLASSVTTITTQQASDITTNNAKTGITSGQASAIVANTAKTGITSGQASAITANTAKTGITSGQASAITANTAKTGITSGQASAITANTAKTGITSGQASAITANTAKVTNATHTGEVTGSAALTIANDVITYAKLGAEFTTSGAITTALNFGANQVFTKTMTANTTFTYSNVGIGMVKDFILSGNYTPTFPSGTKTIAGTYDGSVSNLIQIVAIANGDYWMSISKAQ